MAEFRKDIDQQTFERIEAYLAGRMDATERSSFEMEMAEQEWLRDEVGLQRKLMATVEAGSYLASNPFAQQAKVRPMFSKRRFWYVAAAIALIVSSAGLIIWQQTREKDLFARYFQSDPGLPVVMSSSDAYDFYDGMVSYKEGQFQDAIVKWESLGEKQGFTDTLQYYVGVAQIQISKYAEAASHLQIVAENNKSAFREQATWYLALVHIKLGDKASAARWLKTIPGYEQADKLLAEPGMEPTP
jgi:tetratricopeptide (TPR) repeat protein